MSNQYTVLSSDHGPSIKLLPTQCLSSYVNDLDCGQWCCSGVQLSFPYSVFSYLSLLPLQIPCKTQEINRVQVKTQQPGPFFDLLDAHHLCRRTAGISSPEWSCWLRGKLLAIEQRKSSEISSQMTTATAFHTMASGLPYQPLCRLP